MQVARHRLASLVCGALLLAGGAGSALGQTAGRPTIPEKPALAAAAPLDARLEAVVDAFRTGGQLAAARAAKAQRVRLSPQLALVVVGAKSSVGATRTAITSVSGSVSGVGGRSLEARVPLAKLRTLARDVRVERIEAPMLFTADVVSEGAAVTRAPLGTARASPEAASRLRSSTRGSRDTRRSSEPSSPRRSRPTIFVIPVQSPERRTTGPPLPIRR